MAGNSVLDSGLEISEDELWFGGKKCMSIFQDHEKSRDKLGNLTTLMLHPRGLLTAFSLAKNDFRKNWKSSSLPTIPHKHLHQSARITFQAMARTDRNMPKSVEMPCGTHLDEGAKEQHPQCPRSRKHDALMFSDFQG